MAVGSGRAAARAVVNRRGGGAGPLPRPGAKGRGGKPVNSGEFEDQHPRARGGLWTKKSGQAPAKPLSRKKAEAQVMKPLRDKQKAEAKTKANAKATADRKAAAKAKGHSRTGTRTRGGKNASGASNARRGGDSRTGNARGVMREGDGMTGKPDKGVKKLQSVLVGLGLDLGAPGVDGRYGPITKRAVAQFQKDHGLEASGTFGPRTAAALAGEAKKTTARWQQGVIDGPTADSPPPKRKPKARFAK